MPDEYRARHAEVPWRLMAGFRDVLMHGYEGVDLARVWEVATRDLPQVRAATASLLPPLEQLEKELAQAEDDSGTEPDTQP